MGHNPAGGMECAAEVSKVNWAMARLLDAPEVSSGQCTRGDSVSQAAVRCHIKGADYKPGGGAMARAMALEPCSARSLSWEAPRRIEAWKRPRTTGLLGDKADCRPLTWWHWRSDPGPTPLQRKRGRA